MSGNKLALDTNQVIALLGGQTETSSLLRRFSEIYLPIPVVARNNSLRRTGCRGK